MTTPAMPIVLRDFPDVGKYKVRLMTAGRDNGRTKTWLDVREYASGPNYMGFTRRGVKLSTLEELRLLRETIEKIDREKLFA